MNRGYWRALVLLALAAAGSELVLWLLREPAPDELFTGPPRSDYTLAGYTLDALDSTGNPSFSISGPRLARNHADGSIHADTPDYVLAGTGPEPWRGHSESAWVSADGSLMKLLGAVALERPASPAGGAITVHTRDLTVHPRTGKVETAAAATIEGAGSILRGTGLRGDLNEKTLELLADVHSTLEPVRARR